MVKIECDFRYKRKLAELLEDEEEKSSAKYSQIAEEQARAERELLDGQSRLLSPGLS